MTGPIVVSSGASSHVGARRTLNEDAWLGAAPIFIVADGMGGHDAGELASAAVVAQFACFVGRPSLDLDDLRDAVARARGAVDALPSADMSRAGATLSGVAISAVDGTGYWLALNIGDSRTYRLADGELEQITVDHSVVQELVEAGALTEEEALTDRRKNIITRAIGGGSLGEADYWLFPADVGDRMLICSDGLTGELSDQRIGEVLRTESDPQTAANILVTEAVEAGGRDNVTAMVVDAVLVVTRPGFPIAADEPDVADTHPRQSSEGVWQ